MAKTYVCHSCGKVYSKTCNDASYIGNNCFDCSFWMEKIEMAAEDDARKVIVDGEHYMIGIDDTGIIKGFGGRKFTILFQDGRLIVTRNLWDQGEIPDRFRDLLSDNAVFLQTGEMGQMIHSTDGGAHGLV